MKAKTHSTTMDTCRSIVSSTGFSLIPYASRLTGALLCAAAIGTQSGCGTVDAPQAIAMSVAVEQADSSQETPRWNGWRGGAAMGVSVSEAPTHWASPDVRWRVELPGSGNSSPVVWGEHILLTAEESNELSLLSFHRNGTLQWRQTLTTSTQPTHQRNGHASATVATNGDVIIAKLGNSLHALTIQGLKLWRVDLPVGNHKWGAASSPVICGNAVLQLSDGPGPSELASYALADGSLFWKAPIESDGSWSTPLIVRDAFARPTSVVVNGTGSTNGEPGRVISFNVLTGERNWEVSGTSDIPCPTALFASDRVISATGINGPVLAIHHETGKLLWRLPAGGAQVPTGIVAKEMIYLISDHGMVTCRNISDGSLFWKRRLPGKFSASLVATPSHIYAVNERGRVFAFAISDSAFQLLGESDLEESCLATPAVVDDQLLFRTNRHLVCIGQQQVALESSGGEAHLAGESHATPRTTSPLLTGRASNSGPPVLTGVAPAATMDRGVTSEFLGAGAIP